MATNNKKLILLGGGFTTNNMGVWALSSGAATAFWQAFPEGEIYFFDYHKQPDHYIIEGHSGAKNVQLINIRFSKKVWLPNNIARLLLHAAFAMALPSKALRKRLIKRNYWLNHLYSADIIGSIAGGDSFSDIYGIGRLVYVALPQILILLLKKPLVLLPQTIGPFQTSLGKFIGRFILNRAKKVYSRDSEGLETLKQDSSCGTSKFAFCYDMGFFLIPKIKQERVHSLLGALPGKATLVGLNISGLLYIGGYTRQNMFGLKIDYAMFIQHVIEHFVVQHNAYIMLVPHVFSEQADGESDESACRDIYRRQDEAIKKHLILFDERYSHHELKALVGRCEFFLGSRMHACIAALSQGVPAIGLAYSRKFRGVYASLDVEDLVIDLRDSDQIEIIGKIDTAYVGREGYKSRLHKAMPHVQRAISDLFLGCEPY